MHNLLEYLSPRAIHIDRYGIKLEIPINVTQFFTQCSLNYYEIFNLTSAA